jgi:hypothetical protein
MPLHGFIHEQGLKRRPFKATWQEIHATREPVGLGSLFRFATVGRLPDPCNVWVEPIWCAPYDEHEPRALPGER